MATSGKDELTPREREVLDLVKMGLARLSRRHSATNLGLVLLSMVLPSSEYGHAFAPHGSWRTRSPRPSAARRGANGGLVCHA